MAVLFPTPLSAKLREEIATKEIWHFSKATLDQLLVSKLHGAPGMPNAIVRLCPPTRGYQNFWSAIRDLSMFLAPAADDPMEVGRYLYCFLDKPSFLARITNVQNAPLVVRIPGAELLQRVSAANLFSRLEPVLSTTIVIRGDYIGPALLDPPPP